MPSTPPAGAARGLETILAPAELSFHGVLTDPRVTGAAVVAVRRAAALWGQRLSSAVPTRIDVTFGPTAPGVLATAAPTAYYPSVIDSDLSYPTHATANWTGIPDQLFPADMQILISNTEPGMYVGVDGRPGPGQVDLETVAMHAIGNGLGIMGDFQVVDGLGEYGRPAGWSQPDVYDSELRDAAGRDLVRYHSDVDRGYVPHTAELAAALTSGDLTASVADLNVWGVSTPMKMYAPSTFEPGSTGLPDEATYPRGDASSLMTPVLEEQEVIRDPGLLTLGLLDPLGQRAVKAPSGPLPSDIDLRYAQDAQLRTQLGDATSPERVAGEVHERDYQRGRIVSSPDTGIHAVVGAVFGAYVAGGGASVFGLPLTDEAAAPDGRGRFSDFSRGASIYWSPQTGAHAVRGAVRDRWLAAGGVTGLGYPLTDEAGTPDGTARVSVFDGGASVYWTPAGGAHAVRGAVRARWLAAGGAVALGYPITDELATADGAGRYNDFGAGASVYWSAASGAHAVRGAVRGAWLTAGGTARLGYPLGDETGSADGIGRYSEFSSGATVTWTPRTGAHAVYGAIRGLWVATGRETGLAGYPTVDEAETADHQGRIGQFSKGVSILWSPGRGAHEVHGAIRDRWNTLGGVLGYLGHPTSDEAAVPGGRRSTFDGGFVTWTPTGGARDQRR